MKITKFILLIILAAIVMGCNDLAKYPELKRAEDLMEAHPDSALMILREFKNPDDKSKPVRAKYALLMSMALDKNYIDTTNFDVLQPAIEYYLKSGTADEKLRTYYYQGRIYQNKIDYDNALNSYLKAFEVAPQCHDSLTLARLYVANAIIYEELRDFTNYTEYYLQSEKIFKALGREEDEIDCLLGAVNGCLQLKDQLRADSILSACKKYESLTPAITQDINSYNLAYAIEFSTTEEIENAVNYFKQKIVEYNVNDIMTLALAYNKLGNNNIAGNLIESISELEVKNDMKYQGLLILINRGSGRYKEAFDGYLEFSRKTDSINYLKFNDKIKIVEKKHLAEIAVQKAERKKVRITWISISSGIFLILCIIILIFAVSRNRTIKNMALLEARNQSLENEYLRVENNNKTLVAESLEHKVEELNDEIYTLKKLLTPKSELPPEVQKEIQQRIEVLNSLVAGYITSNERHEQQYDEWIKNVTIDVDKFMNSNRLAFQVSHPKFIKKLESHGLSTKEINYVCLYALGLRGTEVGKYMKRDGHKNMSSEIRKKLGLDINTTNIGIYIRRLLKNPDDENCGRRIVKDKDMEL